jgi:hypothetical protein
MAGSDQMRAAWSRRPDEELLHAYFLEELSPEGQRVVADLVAAKVGDIAAYVQGFVDEQGGVVARFPVRGVEVGIAVTELDLPPMWGAIALTTRGLGFLPGGHDDELVDAELGERIGDLFGGTAGSLAGRIGGSVWSQLKRTARPVQDLAGTAGAGSGSESGALSLPLPLLARLEPSVIWLAHGEYDEVLWGPDFGEVVRDGERLLALEPPPATEAIVEGWAAAHGVVVRSVDPSPLFR